MYKRWQVIIGFILFMLIMGIVGKFDHDYQDSLDRQSQEYIASLIAGGKP